MNNVNTDKIQAFANEAKTDNTKALKTKKVTVEWQMTGPQMISTLEHGSQKTIVQADMAPILGGEARAPDPVQYCLFGTASCFAATFATHATQQGLSTTMLKVTAENKVNLSQALGIGHAPVVEQVSITVEVNGSGTNEQWKKIEQLTLQTCPGIYCLTHAIPVRVETKNT